MYKKNDYENISINELIHNNKIKFSEDISSSDLIYKTKILLLKSTKVKMDSIKQQITSNNEKEHGNSLNHYSNYVLNQKYKQKYTDLNMDSRYGKSIYPRNESSNLRDLKISSGIYGNKHTQFTNFNYKKYDKIDENKNYGNHLKSNMESINISMEKLMLKDYTSFNECKKLDSEIIFKNNKLDKLFNKEIIKKKIDREIYHREKHNFIYLGSGNNSKEINFITQKDNEINDNLLTNKARNKYLDYKQYKNQK